ncbi:unnamed protein product [Lathyrus oleraceus]
MVGILKFVSVVILFLFLFLVTIEADDKHSKCERDDDCPKNLYPYFVSQCINNKCEWFRKNIYDSMIT